MFKLPIWVKEFITQQSFFLLWEDQIEKQSSMNRLLVPEVLLCVQLWVWSLQITPSACLSNYLTKVTQMLDDCAALVLQPGHRVCILIWIHRHLCLLLCWRASSECTCICLRHVLVIAARVIRPSRSDEISCPALLGERLRRHGRRSCEFVACRQDSLGWIVSFQSLKCNKKLFQVSPYVKKTGFDWFLQVAIISWVFECVCISEVFCSSALIHLVNKRVLTPPALFFPAGPVLMTLNVRSGAGELDSGDQ